MDVPKSIFEPLFLQPSVSVGNPSAASAQLPCADSTPTSTVGGDGHHVAEHQDGTSHSASAQLPCADIMPTSTVGGDGQQATECQNGEH